MLSFDFTDRQVKIVRGSLSGSKIRIIQVEKLELPEGIIENGFVADVPMLASEILEFLQSKDIKDKEVIAEIGSGLILHKELLIPKPKNMKNSFVIETMIQNNMNINADYNITFNIVEETEDENKNPMIRVMATAVPQRLVDGYVKLFSHLGLPLKSLYVSTNCISRLVQNSQKMAAQMPLMMVEVENDFISINLYDDSRILLSRRVSIDLDEEEDENESLVQLVYDNVFRMVQFINGRPGSKPLKEIIFYGRIPDFIMLTNAMSSFNTSTHILSAPGNVVSFCEYDFAEFANAIAAFYKLKKDFDRIDMLQATAAKEKKQMGSYGFVLAGCLLGAVVLVGGAYLVINGINNSIKGQTAVIEAEINSPEIQDRINLLNAKVERLNGISLYSNAIQEAKLLFDFQPKTVTEVLEKLEENLPDGMYIEENVQVDGYDVVAHFVCEDYNQPAEYVKQLYEQGYFENIVYTGYEGEIPTDNEDNNNNNNNNNANGHEDVTYKFTLSMLLKGGNAYESE